MPCNSTPAVMWYIAYSFSFVSRVYNIFFSCIRGITLLTTFLGIFVSKGCITVKGKPTFQNKMTLRILKFLEQSKYV